MNHKYLLIMFLPYKIKDSEITSLVHGDIVSRNYCNEYSILKQKIKTSIDSVNIENTIINGTQLQEEWFPVDFPDMKFDVFISHSHTDVNKSVLPLASWFYKHLGLRCFIDSLYWQYADDLLKKFDDYYAYKADSKTYDYQIRNYTTSHVHIMLSMALMKMMDKTECVLFVDSDNNIKYKKGESQTPSPWIYEEISFANSLQVRIPQRYYSRIRPIYESGGRLSERVFSDVSNPNIRYSVDLGKFQELTSTFLKSIKSKGYDALDIIHKKMLDASKFEERIRKNYLTNI